MDKRMVLYDGLDARDKTSLLSSSTAFDTSIDIKCLETGEVLFKGLKNKVIIPGSGLIARKLFDISSPEITPSYNDAFGDAMYTPEISEPLTEELANRHQTVATKDNHKILLFCVGIDGCGTENSQVYPVDYRQWIDPNDLIPFRYQLANNDLSADQREEYFGRTSINGGEFYAYYFKRFDGGETDNKLPSLFQKYIDGTDVQSTIYEDAENNDMSAETYVELNLRITKDDIRDYFVATVGIDEARINSISLCSAYPVSEKENDLDAEGNHIEVDRIYFKDIRPLTKLHIPNEQLIDVTKGIEIIYHIYM